MVHRLVVHVKLNQYIYICCQPISELPNHSPLKDACSLFLLPTYHKSTERISLVCASVCHMAKRAGAGRKPLLGGNPGFRSQKKDSHADQRRQSSFSHLPSSRGTFDQRKKRKTRDINGRTPTYLGTTWRSTV